MPPGSGGLRQYIRVSHEALRVGQGRLLGDELPGAWKTRDGSG